MIKLTIFNGPPGFEKISINPGHVVSIERLWSDHQQKHFFAYLMSTGKEYKLEESPEEFDRLMEQQLEAGEL